MATENGLIGSQSTWRLYLIQKSKELVLISALIGSFGLEHGLFAITASSSGKVIFQLLLMIKLSEVQHFDAPRPYSLEWPTRLTLGDDIYPYAS